MGRRNTRNARRAFHRQPRESASQPSFFGELKTQEKKPRRPSRFRTRVAPNNFRLWCRSSLPPCDEGVERKTRADEEHSTHDDEFWEKLSEGGEEGSCGWLKDKYGVSWQINPTILGEMLHDPDPGKSKRVMEAMLKMKKIEIEGLKKAYEQP